jgi:hypothetical protein
VPVLKFGTGAKASAVEMQVAVIHGHRVPPVGLFGTYPLIRALPSGQRVAARGSLLALSPALCPGAPVPRSPAD